MFGVILVTIPGSVCWGAVGWGGHRALILFLAAPTALTVSQSPLCAHGCQGRTALGTKGVLVSLTRTEDGRENLLQSTL